MGKLNRILGILVWSVEHQLSEPSRFLYELGNIWYHFWIVTPIEANLSLCVFCRKECPGKWD